MCVSTRDRQRERGERERKEGRIQSDRQEWIGRLIGLQISHLRIANLLFPPRRDSNTILHTFSRLLRSIKRQNNGIKKRRKKIQSITILSPNELYNKC